MSVFGDSAYDHTDGRTPERRPTAAPGREQTRSSLIDALLASNVRSFDSDEAGEIVDELMAALEDL